MYWALFFAIIASHMIYSVGFCSKQASDLSLRPVGISSTYCNGTMLQRLHVLTLLMYWALSFAIIASYMIYSVGFCSKQASVTI